MQRVWISGLVVSSTLHLLSSAVDQDLRLDDTLQVQKPTSD
jgi:hypothetical protein